MAYTFINISRDEEERERSYWMLWLLGICAVLVVCLLRWGGYLLVSHDSIPDHSDAAVVLQGPIDRENARTALAMELLQRGTVNRVAISLPGESYWGIEMPLIARPYLEKKYGADLAGRIDFCVTETDVMSTQEEVRALNSCIQAHGWKSIALVTSNYQGRRVGMVWRKTLSQGENPVLVTTQGVPDPDYQPRGWWRQRLYAETWFKESAKLALASL